MNETQYFFDQLLFDFVQYDLFDPYLNYRLPELIHVCGSCFEKIKIEKDEDNTKKISDNDRSLFEKITLIEEQMESINYCCLKDWEKEEYKNKMLKLLPLLEQFINKIFEDSTQTLSLLTQIRCSRVLVFILEYYYKEKNELSWLAFFFVLLNDRESISFLVREKGLSFFLSLSGIIFLLDQMSRVDKREKQKRKGSWMEEKFYKIIWDYDFPINTVSLFTWMIKNFKFDFSSIHKDSAFYFDNSLFFTTKNVFLYELALNNNVITMGLEYIIRYDSLEIFKFLLLQKKILIDQKTFLEMEKKPNSKIFQFWSNLENKKQYLLS